MASIFHSLNVGYSGLKASQISINTIGHNIANAETEGYTRQRSVAVNAIPLKDVRPGSVGSGVMISDIKRIHDEFVFSRYVKASAEKEFSDFQRQTLEELSVHFPEIQGVGIKNDLENYFAAWEDLAENPNSSATKVGLAQATKTLTLNLNQTAGKLKNIQVKLNKELKINIDEVNRLGGEISKINAEINLGEAIKGQHANDLRDQRGRIEIALNKLIDVNVFNGELVPDTLTDRNIKETTESYNINIKGYSFVDGKTLHPLVIDNKGNPGGNYSIYYERQDGVRTEIVESLRQGKVGAILSLRGGSPNEYDDGYSDGIIQDTIDQLDVFAKTLAEETNNIYARSAQKRMVGDSVPKLRPTSTISNSELNIDTTKSFDIVIYSLDGKEVGRKNIELNQTTVMKDNPITKNSIVGQINASTDDNKDNNSINDVDDFFTASYSYDKIDNAGIFQLTPSEEAKILGLRIAIEDKGSNFAGAMGASRFFDGHNSRNLSLNSEYARNSALIQANSSSELGNNDVANDMLQLQFDKKDFILGANSVNDTISGYFDYIVTGVATTAEDSITRNETLQAKLSSVEQQYESVSKVNIDEEMIGLIKHQAAYSANAKVISTIDQMLDTLLGIKR